MVVRIGGPRPGWTDGGRPFSNITYKLDPKSFRRLDNHIAINERLFTHQNFHQSRDIEYCFPRRTRTLKASSHLLQL